MTGREIIMCAVGNKVCAHLHAVHHFTRGRSHAAGGWMGEDAFQPKHMNGFGNLAVRCIQISTDHEIKWLWQRNSCAAEVIVVFNMHLEE